MSVTNLCAVVAYDKDRGIAKDGALPWDLPLDMALFRFLTDGLPVVVGRKTAEKMQLPLPNRETLILSQNQTIFLDRVKIFQDIESVKQYVLKFQDIIIGGGQTVYEQFMPEIHTIIATEIDGVFNCDRFFPRIDEAQWSSQALLAWQKDEQHSQNFTVVRYERKDL